MFELLFVFTAGLITALATGLGAIPFFFKDDISSEYQVVLWGLASGIMVAASIFGLFWEGIRDHSVLPVLVGAFLGGLLVLIASKYLDLVEVNPTKLPEADFKSLLLILGVLTVHSFPEGVAVGVSFAEMGIEGGAEFFGLSIPVLAITMTIAISIHNIPEGVAVSIPLKNLGMSKMSLVGWSIFTSLPQPIGAVIAFSLVRYAKSFLPYGFGFAGGAMVYLVFTEFFPDALDEGSHLRNKGWPQLLSGFFIGLISMALFLLW